MALTQPQVSLAKRKHSPLRGPATPIKPTAVMQPPESPCAAQQAMPATQEHHGNHGRRCGMGLFEAPWPVPLSPLTTRLSCGGASARSGPSASANSAQHKNQSAWLTDSTRMMPLMHASLAHVTGLYEVPGEHSTLVLRSCCLLSWPAGLPHPGSGIAIKAPTGSQHGCTPKHLCAPCVSPPPWKAAPSTRTSTKKHPPQKLPQKQWRPPPPTHTHTRCLIPTATPLRGPAAPSRVQARPQGSPFSSSWVSPPLRPLACLLPQLLLARAPAPAPRAPHAPPPPHAPRACRRSPSSPQHSAWPTPPLQQGTGKQAQPLTLRE